MAEQQDNAQKTEDATPKRLEEARKKGDAPKSQEVIAAIMLGAGALGLWLLAGPAARGIAEAGAPFIERPHEFLLDSGALQEMFAGLSIKLAATLAGFAMLFLAAALLANAGQSRPVFTTERMKPSLQKISPLAGLKRIFGPSGLFNFAKGVGKIILVGAILALALWPDRESLVTALYSNGLSLLDHLRMLLLKLIGLTVLAMIVISGLDYAFQRHSWKQRLRMTKEEVRRELKESEGDPQIKGRQRQLRDTRARKRMVAAVKDATVLIMNPTHFAVALDYEMGAEAAPICIAKGVDDVALRMRAAAQEYGVPVVENPPLARALHAAAEIDEEIPIDHYEAVAKVIGFVMRKATSAGALN